jgi:cobyrinic acid a,c-diamide synthase
VELAFFSPLRDGALPAGTAAIYLGGGYAELHAGALAANERIRSAIRSAADSGMPVYAECGGYLYLLDALDDMDGRAHAGCGVFPGRARIGARLAALGYRDCATLVPSLVGPAGSRVTGHVFHYATVQDSERPALAMMNGRHPDLPPVFEGGSRDMAFGSFLHVHFAANAGLAKAIVEAARAYARR